MIETKVPSVSGNDSRMQSLLVALVGNPNGGKTTLFNSLTGLRQKVGNYPGVTVERKEGRLELPSGRNARLIDLPGLYSLTPHSPDEVLAREVLLGLRSDIVSPDIILNVVDSSNLERNLYLTSQLLEIGIPVIVALTMTDMMDRSGNKIDAHELSKRIGAPIIIVVAPQKLGLVDLLRTLDSSNVSMQPTFVHEIPEEIRDDFESLLHLIEETKSLPSNIAHIEADRFLMMDRDTDHFLLTSPEIRGPVNEIRERIAAKGIDFATAEIEGRYKWIETITKGLVSTIEGIRKQPIDANERVDRIILHPVFGYVLFFFVMAVVFQSIFTWAKFPMDWIKTGIDMLGVQLEAHMAPGELRELLKGGVLGGVGNTIAFLPQILLLFFFISLLEDTGYMARAAFLMDKLMSKVGLHGRSFIPLLSSFACAIPGIMATRTIGDRKARLITILVAPLMSCSARIPVYALMIGAFIPPVPVVSIGKITLLTLPGVTLLAMYFLGMIAAFCIAWIFHKTILKGVAPAFLMELPPYRVPHLKDAAIQMLERAGMFLKRAGTMILAISVILWALTTYPRHLELPEGERASHSVVGVAGHIIEPTIAPLGFNWKMGIAIISSFAAREVFVTAMGTVYNVNTDSTAGRVDLQDRLKADKYPDGKPVYTPLVAVCLMIFYVLAMQCMSTVAVVRRETGGWKWALFQMGYMTSMAWIVTFIVYQAGKALGYG